MRIEAGLFSHMVMQRTRGSVSQQRFTGASTASGAVEVRWRAEGKKARGKWRCVGRAGNGKFSGCLRGIPVGGPYHIELRIRDRGGQVFGQIEVRDVLVGDVWILAGQSNMEGVGWRKHALPPHPMVRNFYMTDEWDIAKDPLHTLWCAVDPVHGGVPGASRHKISRHSGVGPGLSYGREMFQRTGIPQGLIACAHGGTSMAQWDPALKKKGGESLYGAMFRRVQKNGGRVAGILWYQGCSDTNREAASLYTRRMINLVRAMRRDFRDARLPVVMVQIARVVGWRDATFWNSIQEQQRQLPRHIPHLAVVPAVDLDLDDCIHISGYDQNRLGKRLAYAMRVLREGRRAGLPPIELKSISINIAPETKLGVVAVRFANVVGSLRAAGKPSGMSIEGCDGPLPVYRLDLAGDCVLLRSLIPPKEINGELWYGRGTSPYCNITDEADRSLPVFGPVHIGRPRALTPFVKQLEITPFLSHRHVKRLPGVLVSDSLHFAVRTFPANFCNLHDELRKAGSVLVYYRCRFACEENMRLHALFGYDGPVKVWYDGRAIFCDPRGTNPAVVDSKAIPLRASKGKHEIVIALDSNRGKAWGIFLRFERIDLAISRIRQGGYCLPRF